MGSYYAKILNTKIEVLYKSLHRKRFQSAYRHIGPVFKREEEAFLKFFCTRERLCPHMIKVYSPLFKMLWSL